MKKLKQTIVRLSSFLAAWFLLLCFEACREDVPQAVLNESEIAFDHRLSTISLDTFDDNRYYIGTEDGSVIVYQSVDGSSDILSTPFDRIYRVVRDSVDNYWIGTRNMGVFRCCKHSDRLDTLRRYTIPASGKKTQYSVYDICIKGSEAYFATSHGLFLMSDSSQSMLRPLRVEPYADGTSRLHPVVYSHILDAGNNTLYCSSAHGLVGINTVSKETYVCLKADLHCIALHGDSIFALAKSAIRIYDMKEHKERDSINLDVPAQLYYYEPAQKVNYLICDNSLQLVEDKNLKNRGQYKCVDLRRTVRPSTCRNIIVNDTARRQSLMVTRNSIIRMCHHQDAFNSFGAVDHACADGDNIYYIIGHKLYRQNKNDSVAHHIKDISHDVRFMTVKDDVLFFVDSDNRAYRAKLCGSYLWNSIWSSNSEITPRLPKDVTAIGKNRQRVMVGVRDGFCNLNAANDTIILGDEEPFVTAIRQKSDGSIVLCTLNEGIFVEEKGVFSQVHATDTIHFIRDVAAEGNSLWFINNRHLYHLMEDGTLTSEEAQGYSRLLVASGHVYGIGERGMHDFTDKTDYFVDVPFNPDACLVADGKVYCGSGSGVFCFGMLRMHNGVEMGAQKISFENGFWPFSRKSLLILSVLTIMIVVALWIIDRYRLSRKNVTGHKADLIGRLGLLNEARTFLEKDTREHIDRLKSQVAAVDVAGGRKALSAMRSYSTQVQSLTATVSMELRDELGKQTARLKSSCMEQKEQYVKDTQREIAHKNIRTMLFQLEQNRTLLLPSEKMKRVVENYHFLFKAKKNKRPYALYIEGISQKVEDIATDESLTLQQQLKMLNETIAELATEERRKELEDILHSGAKETATLKATAGTIGRSGVGEDVGSPIEKEALCVVWADAIETKYRELKRAVSSLVPDKVYDTVCDIVYTNQCLYELDILSKVCSEVAKDNFGSSESKEVNEFIEKFYKCLNSSRDEEVIKAIKLKTDNQEGRILALAVACEHLFPFSGKKYSEILKVKANDSSLSRAKGVLLTKLDEGKDFIREHTRKNPTSIFGLADDVVAYLSER